MLALCATIHEWRPTNTTDRLGANGGRSMRTLLKHMWKAPIGLLMALSFMSMGCSSDSIEQTGTSCEADSDCATYTVCVEGTCREKSCTGLLDCAPGQLCLPKPDSDETVCTAPECSDEVPCPFGGTCNNGICEGGTGGNPCEDASACTEGQICNASGLCEPDPNSLAGICTECASNDDCTSGVCVQVGNQQACLSACESSAECSSGFQCYENACVPGAFNCTGCLVDGCPEAGTHCNANTGACVATKNSCDACQFDGDCGAGLRCYNNFCVPECGDAQCPINGTCTDIGEGVRACAWNSSGPCCLGEGCATAGPCDACGGSTPFCKDDAICVECLDDTNCSGNTPKCENNQCIPDNAECSGQTPYYNVAKDECCECLDSTHCSGNACDPTTCSCQTAGGAECDSCVAPYPGCAEFQGQFVCVQCSEDIHCNGNTCNLETYTCEGGGPPPATGNCQTTGCTADGTTSGNVASCDAATGLCYDPEGNCDNISTFCPNGGQCLSLLEQLGGDLGGLDAVLDQFAGALPEGGGLPGSCTCTPGPGSIPGFGGTQGDCPDGLTCGPGLLGLLLGLLNQGGQTPPNTCSAGLDIPLPF